LNPPPGSTDPERFATVSIGIGDRVSNLAVRVLVAVGRGKVNLHLAALLGSDEVLSWWPGHSDDAGHTAPSPSSPSGQGEAGVETRSGDLHGDLQ